MLIHVLEEQSRAIETFINCAESDDVRNAYENLYDKTEKSFASLVFEKLEANKGPISASTDAVLTKYNIKPQSCHGGAFTWNHCHNYMANEVYKHLTQNMVDKCY